MNIMVTNDDGITAPGIIALAAALRDLTNYASMDILRGWELSP